MTITDKLAEQHIREYESRLKHLDGGLIDCITGLVFTQLHRKNCIKAQADNRSVPYNLYPHAAH